MKTLMGAAAIVLLLAGCNDEKQSEAGDYLFESVKIEFDNSDANSSERGREAFQKRLVSVLNEDGKDIYYSITPTEIITYGFGEKESDSIADGRVKLKDVWYTIKPDGANTLRLISDKDSECVIFLCQINLTLKKVAPDSAELRARQVQNEKDIQAAQKKMDGQRDEFMDIPMPDVPGTLFTPAEGFTLKLPWRFEGKVSHEDIAEGYHQQIDRLTIENVNRAYFTERRKNLGSLFSQSDDEDAEGSSEESAEKVLESDADKPANEGSLVWLLRNEDEGFNLFLNIVQGKKEDIDLTRWLATQKAVIFRSQHGAVYYDESDHLHVIYLQYNEATQRYFVGIGDVQSIPDAANAFAILRTVDARYRGNVFITLNDLTLSPTEQEIRYQTTLESLFDREAAHQDMRNALEYQLKKPFRFMKMGTTYADIEFKSESKRREIDIAFSVDPVQELIAQAKRLHPEGKAVGDLFIYGDSYNYYRDMGNDMTLVFTVPGTIGNLVERIMLLSVLRQFDMSTLPQIPASERKNLQKYSGTDYRQSKPDDHVFDLHEGIIDSHGNLIIANSEAEYFSYAGGSPKIITHRWVPKAERPKGYIFDEKGQLLVKLETVRELINNRLLIAGDGEKMGFYDLQALRWRIEPRWNEIKWLDGVFIASDDHANDRLSTLLDSDLKVLAIGKQIAFYSDTDYLAVTGKKDNVSLIDRQGRVLFSRPGNGIYRIPEIDAYQVVLSQPDSSERAVGIFSERGETILPMKYRYALVEGDRLKMWGSDSNTISWFSVEQVKNWRDNQPLKEVAAPE